jgi:hypothetical protein
VEERSGACLTMRSPTSPPAQLLYADKSNLLPHMHAGPVKKKAGWNRMELDTGRAVAARALLRDVKNT